jgi:basic membrane lipoprotein Med (substrate-binding protein (PBP1-ABC) superfamily)
VRVLSSYIGNWDDVSAGKEQALALIARGADVIFQNADAAGIGVFQAARESRRAMIIGSNANQNDVAPEVTLGSVVIDLPHAFLTLAREVKNGTFRPRVVELGEESGVVTYVPNPATADKVPAAVRQRADSLQRLMLAGRYSAPKSTDSAATSR